MQPAFRTDPYLPPKLRRRHLHTDYIHCRRNLNDKACRHSHHGITCRSNSLNGSAKPTQPFSKPPHPQIRRPQHIKARRAKGAQTCTGRHDCQHKATAVRPSCHMAIAMALTANGSPRAPTRWRGLPPSGIAVANTHHENGILPMPPLRPNCALCNKSPPGATRAMGAGDTHGKADAM